MKRKQSKQPRTRHKRGHVKCKEDRISSLPDCLLIDIISRLPDMEQAIRTGTLSKRWQHLWPQVHNLIFKHYDEDDEDLIREFFLFVDKALIQFDQPNINKFKLHCSFSNETKPQVNNCIRYAIDHNVQEFEFNLWDYSECTGFDFFFSCSSFVYLKLHECTFDQTGVISWKNLKSLSLTCTLLDEDLIQNVLSGSPLLETLVLKDCCGFDRLDITNKSVKNLVFSGDLDDAQRMVSLKINAPYILSLTINNDFTLYKLLLLNVSSATKAELNYSNNIHYKPLKTNEKMLKGLILSLCHVKELKIGKRCLKTLARLEAKGLISIDYDSSQSEDCSDNDSTESED